MALDLSRFFKASNPTRTLDLSKEGDRKYYVDFSSVRGTNIINELMIEKQSGIANIETLDRLCAKLF